MPTNMPGAVDTTMELPNDKVDGSSMADHDEVHNNLSDALLAAQYQPTISQDARYEPAIALQAEFTSEFVEA